MFAQIQVAGIDIRILAEDNSVGARSRYDIPQRQITGGLMFPILPLVPHLVPGIFLAQLAIPGAILGIAIATVATVIALIVVLGVRFIPNDQAAIVETLW